MNRRGTGDFQGSEAACMIPRWWTRGLSLVKRMEHGPPRVSAHISYGLQLTILYQHGSINYNIQHTDMS